jgi:branched-subunit amino acid ABC-type transport system permease component
VLVNRTSRADADLLFVRDRRCVLPRLRCIGWLVEWGLIRNLYQRPLDTLLATWGLSLAMQQAFRSTFGASEVRATLPDWLMGSWSPT